MGRGFMIAIGAFACDRTADGTNAAQGDLFDLMLGEIATKRDMTIEQAGHPGAPRLLSRLARRVAVHHFGVRFSGQRQRLPVARRGRNCCAN